MTVDASDSRTRRPTRDRSQRWRIRRAEWWQLRWRGARQYARRRRAAPVLPPPRRARRGRPAFTVPELHPGAPPQAVALTIDDGPHPRWTPHVLDLLEEHEIAATFFLVGRNVERHPALAQRIAAAGHTICNHSMRHPEPFAALAPHRLHGEIAGAQRCIEDTVQVAPRLFRAPAGGWSPRVLDAVVAAGLIAVDWDIDPRDWALPGTAQIVRTLRRSQAGDILLCHDGGDDSAQTVAALAAVLPELQRRGLRFVTL